MNQILAQQTPQRRGSANESEAAKEQLNSLASCAGSANQRGELPATAKLVCGAGLSGSGVEGRGERAAGGAEALLLKVLFLGFCASFSGSLESSTRCGRYRKLFGEPERW
ncbi:hypothetical protein AOLI_G00295160 [Acnodon oligacanthus]